MTCYLNFRLMPYHNYQTIPLKQQYLGVLSENCVSQSGSKNNKSLGNHASMTNTNSKNTSLIKQSSKPVEKGDSARPVKLDLNSYKKYQKKAVLNFKNKVAPQSNRQ